MTHFTVAKRIREGGFAPMKRIIQRSAVWAGGMGRRYGPAVWAGVDASNRIMDICHLTDSMTSGDLKGLLWEVNERSGLDADPGSYLNQSATDFCR